MIFLDYLFINIKEKFDLRNKIPKKFKHKFQADDPKFDQTEMLKNKYTQLVDSSVGRALSFSHEGPQFKSGYGHLFVSLLICDLIDC